MSRPFTEDQLLAQVVEDRTWRIREISDLKAAIRRGDENLRRVLLRALVTLCYAHWEGYVRFTARKYLDHVALRRFQYRELDRQFLRNRFLPRLAALSFSKTSIADRCALMDEMLNSFNDRFSRSNDDLVNTKANLNFDTFADICLICGLSAEEFKKHSTFIDILLLKRRNSIAHGEDTLVNLADLDQISEDTISIMRAFGDAVENRVALKEYKVTV